MSVQSPTESRILTETAAIIPSEQAILGCVLMERGVKIPPLMPDEFALDKHRVIWRAILDLAQRGDGVDATTVAHHLRTVGDYEVAGGPAALAFLIEQTLSAAFPENLPTYARHVREAARRRRLLELGLRMANEGLDEHEIQARLKALPGPLVADIFDPADAWAKIVEGFNTKRIKTGLGQMDEVALGLQPADFLVIGSRTSHGKTAFVCHLARHYATLGMQVDVLALEESREQIVRRLVAADTGILTRMIRDGQFLPGQFEACENAVRRLQDLPLSVSDLSHVRSLNEDHIVGMVSASDAPIVIVDHLQKVQTRGESRVYGLERVMNGLHAVALRDKKIVILTAQLNREAEHREGPPQLSDLRDCGAVEILARLIWLLFWPSKKDPARPDSEYEIHVAKQGESGTGIAHVTFHAGSGRFS